MLRGRAKPSTRASSSVHTGLPPPRRTAEADASILPRTAQPGRHPDLGQCPCSPAAAAQRVLSGHDARVHRPRGQDLCAGAHGTCPAGVVGCIAGAGAHLCAAPTSRWAAFLPGRARARVGPACGPHLLGNGTVTRDPAVGGPAGALASPRPPPPNPRPIAAFPGPALAQVIALPLEHGLPFVIPPSQYITYNLVLSHHAFSLSRVCGLLERYGRSMDGMARPRPGLTTAGGQPRPRLGRPVQIQVSVRRPETEGPRSESPVPRAGSVRGLSALPDDVTAPYACVYVHACMP